MLYSGGNFKTVSINMICHDSDISKSGWVGKAAVITKVVKNYFNCYLMIQFGEEFSGFMKRVFGGHCIKREQVLSLKPKIDAIFISAFFITESVPDAVLIEIMLNKREKHTAVALIMLSMAVGINAQTDTIRTVILNSVYVAEKKPSFSTTSRDVVAITGTEMKEKGAQTVPEALATLPGVSQLTTGAISKPVIRGLYGNRILINVAGLKLEDQQWEDEHGLGISDVGIERVELIKGPASLMFGSDAMGGVVNIIEENLPEPGMTKQDLNFKLFSNTYGIGLDYGYKKAARNILLIRGGIESHADYSDGDGKRVPNTRFALYNLNLGYFIHHPHFNSENRVLASFNEFGFIADSTDLDEDRRDKRLSRKFENAHHSVLFLMLSSVNSFHVNERTEWNVTLGIQNNYRLEQERSNRVDLSLMLTTFSLNTSIRNKLGDHWTWTNGVAGMLQTNTNHASRIIVPDATLAEGSAFSYANRRQQFNNWNGVLEAGLRYDHRQISTRQTGSLNPPTSEIPPFNRGFDNLNGSLGESLNLGNLLLKLDLSSGFRSGNLAELAANGLHEGTPYWYIGNPKMKVEQCLNADISASWQHKWLYLRGSVFRNRFLHYIYLRPTDDEYYGFKIYRFEQTNATLQGFEAGVSIESKERFNISLDYSFLDAKRDDGSWLPFSPANRVLFDSKYFLPNLPSHWQNGFISFGMSFTPTQNHIDIDESSTPGYWLFQAGAGVSIRSVRFLLTCRNLTNQLYFDHLSRNKYYGLFDMGRNIVMNIGWQF
jgi:iron complex outermembrane recepter protein